MRGWAGGRVGVLGLRLSAHHCGIRAALERLMIKYPSLPLLAPSCDAALCDPCCDMCVAMHVGSAGASYI